MLFSNVQIEFPLLLFDVLFVWISFVGHCHVVTEEQKGPNQEKHPIDQKRTTICGQVCHYSINIWPKAKKDLCLPLVYEGLINNMLIFLKCDNWI